MIENISPGIALLIFILTAVMDALHAIYTKAVADNRPARAASFGSVIYLISGFAVLQYTHNPLYLAFVVAGSWVGTYLSVKYHVFLQKPSSAPPPQGNP